MHKIDGPGATTDNEFTEGNPVTGVPATEVTADWLNTVQREILAVLAAAGIIPDKANDAQLIAAIEALIDGAAITPPDATETTAGVTRYATNAEVLAGTAVQAAARPADVLAAILQAAYFGGVTTLATDAATLNATHIGKLCPINTAVATLTMASASVAARNGQAITLHNVKGSAGNVTINRNGSDVFSVDGASTTSLTIRPGEYATFVRISSTLWYVIGSFLSGSRALGVGQTWQDVTASRAKGTTYTNSTARPIFISVATQFVAPESNANLVVDGVTVSTIFESTSTELGTVTAVVPAGSTYSLSGGNGPITKWAELR